MPDLDVGATDGATDPFLELAADVGETITTDAEGAALAPGAGVAPAAGEPAAEAKLPLTLEEIDKRNNDLKQALHAERGRRQTMERQLRDLMGRFQGGQPPPGGAAAPVKPPNVEEDPIGALKFLLEQASTAEQHQAAETAKTEEQRAQQAAWNDYNERVQSHEAEFIDAQPDYREALQYLFDNRTNELVDLGYPKETAEQMAQREAYFTANKLMSDGVNPARYAYGLAKQRGYTAKAPGQAQRPPAGGAKPAADAASAAIAAVEALALGGGAANPTAGAGGSGERELTWDQVSNLEGAAFDSAFAKLTQQERSRTAA